MEVYVDALPPHTTKRRTTNLKTKYNQNCQKIELHGTLTTKKLKKHSSTPVGAVETSSWGGGDANQGSSWRTGWVRWWLADQEVHICVQIDQEKQLWNKTD